MEKITNRLHRITIFPVFKALIGLLKSQTRYVKKTLSIPYWLNVAAEKEHINFSGVLQESLRARLADSDHSFI